MGKKPREFSREFKLNICRQLVSKQASKSSVMRLYQLGAGTLERWVEQYEVRGEAAFDGQQWRLQEEAESTEAKLRKELELVRLENEFLKACLGKLPEVGERR
jgi:transposase-like protein